MEIKKKDYKNNKNKFKFFTKNNIFTILILISIIFLMFFFTNINSYNPNLKMVSGTEYISGEEGQIIIRLEDEKGKPITNAKCIVSLLYPDKSFFLQIEKCNKHLFLEIILFHLLLHQEKVFMKNILGVRILIIQNFLKEESQVLFMYHQV